jgi:integrase
MPILVPRSPILPNKLAFVRPGELRKAEWKEFDLEGAEWRIPADKMKSRQKHIVPPSKQALALLKELKPLTGANADDKYLFPGAQTKNKPMSENTINVALRLLDYVSGKGWGGII